MSSRKNVKSKTDRKGIIFHKNWFFTCVVCPELMTNSSSGTPKHNASNASSNCLQALVGCHFGSKLRVSESVDTSISHTEEDSTLEAQLLWMPWGDFVGLRCSRGYFFTNSGCKTAALRISVYQISKWKHTFSPRAPLFGDIFSFAFNLYLFHINPGLLFIFFLGEWFSVSSFVWRHIVPSLAWRGRAQVALPYSDIWHCHNFWYLSIILIMK